MPPPLPVDGLVAGPTPDGTVAPRWPSATPASIRDAHQSAGIRERPRTDRGLRYCRDLPTGSTQSVNSADEGAPGGFALDCAREAYDRRGIAGERQTNRDGPS